MKLQTKFGLGITAIFLVLAAGVAAMTVRYVNTNTIREVENRVRVDIRAAWEVYDGKTARVTSALSVLAEDQTIKALLRNPGDATALRAVEAYLQTQRLEQEMDILNLMSADGTVIVRTRPPFNSGDNLSNDPLVRQALASGHNSAGTIILELDRLDLEGDGLVERCLAVGGEPRGMMSGAAVTVWDNGDLLGVIEMGGLLNGASEKVDRMRDVIFENEYYKGKPLGTATIFMDDLRISTNVLDDQGRRAVGTRVSKEVADQVLGQGESWTGRAFVVDRWYLSQYDPIRDPDGKIIGMLYLGELEQKYLDLRTKAVIQQLSVILAGMLAAYVLSFLSIRGVLKPIHRLSEATRTLSEGDLTHRVEVGGNDEVGELSASFNVMCEQLELQRSQLEERQRELEELSDELRTTNKSYIEMLGFVTHELKNPLTSAIMSLYTVKDGYLGELTPAQKRSLESVAQSLDYFQDMIKNYLDLSRLERGDLAVRKRDVALWDHVVAPALDGFEREIQEKGMVVVDHIPDNMTVAADSNLLRIVYDNLLSNALKYGREGGTIMLDASNGGRITTLSVRNDGEGISPERVPQLFKKFSRLESPEYAGKKGTGLGLYICREIIEKHGGEIWVDSKAGEWVKFSFTLPKENGVLPTGKEGD